MAGFSDRAMRILCKKYGADHVTTEMISSKAVWYKDKKTFELGMFDEAEAPCSVQLFGDDPDVMLHAAKELLARYPYCAVDINMGCPVPKIVKNHEGSALMKEPELVERIVSRLAENLPVPVTVKIRAGWDSKSINAPEIAKRAEKGGAAAVFVHGRTREMMYQPSVMLPVIKDVKDAVNIPVIGNGDITDGESAVTMMNVTGCDALMIGRGTLGKPWLFNEIKNRFNESDEYLIPRIKDVIKEHIELKKSFCSDFIALNELRGQIPHYIKGTTGSASMRAKINSASSLAQIAELIENL